MKRLFLTGALLAVFAIAVGYVPASSAPGSLSVVSSSVVAEFPSRLIFSIEAEGPSDIEDIRLHYQVDRMKHVPTTSEAWPSFSPGPAVAASWTWDMRRASLPPGTLLAYWWTVRDSDGVEVETIPKEVAFEDDRYQWRSLESTDLTLYWYAGDDDFAATLMDICEEAIEALAADVGTRVERHIKVYIYASADDLRRAMVYPQEWTGGVAFTEYGIIAIGIGPADLEWGRRALRHELTHLVVHAATFSPFGHLPTWLDEGLAMHNEGEEGVSATFEAILADAVENDRLLTLRTLSGPFSADPSNAYLSYAESHSIVEYLLDEYGSEKMHELLMTFKAGATIDHALESVYGVGLDRLNADWCVSLQQEYANAWT